MSRSKVVRVEEVVEKARAVAKQMVVERIDGIDLEQLEIGWFPDHGTMGLIIHDVKLRQVGTDVTFELAEAITRELGVEGEAGVSITRDVTTMGFFPRHPFVFE